MAIVPQKRSFSEFDMLKEMEVERTLEKRIYGLAVMSPLGLSSPTVVSGLYWPNDNENMERFQYALYDAELAGKISEEQYAYIIGADYIASARRRDTKKKVHVAFEASSKIDRYDVDRAVRSRDALWFAFEDSDALAAVYGWEISEEVRRYAESNGVTVFIGEPDR